MNVIVTATEKRVTELVEAGLSNKEIAVKMGKTETAVKQHLYRIYQKVGVENRCQLLNRDGSSISLLTRT